MLKVAEVEQIFWWTARQQINIYVENRFGTGEVNCSKCINYDHFKKSWVAGFLLLCFYVSSLKILQFYTTVKYYWIVILNPVKTYEIIESLIFGNRTIYWTFR